jgi:hypothetical protein
MCGQQVAALLHVQGVAAALEPLQLAARGTRIGQLLNSAELAAAACRCMQANA